MPLAYSELVVGQKYRVVGVQEQSGIYDYRDSAIGRIATVKKNGFPPYLEFDEPIETRYGPRTDGEWYVDLEPIEPTKPPLVVGQRYRIVALGEDDGYYHHRKVLEGREGRLERIGSKESTLMLVLSDPPKGFAPPFIFLASITLEPITDLSDEAALEEAWQSELDQMDESGEGVLLSHESFTAGWKAALEWRKKHG